ncbi:DUF3147 family protein [Candidatus Latescibacterota bacterium]
MNYLLKLLISVAVIIFATQIGKKIPSAAGLIATMPLTALIVLIWMYLDNPGKNELMINFTRGVVWGILPTIMFFLVALYCFKRQMSLPVVLVCSFSVWLLGAFIHQWFLK